MMLAPHGGLRQCRRAGGISNDGAAWPQAQSWPAVFVWPAQAET